MQVVFGNPSPTALDSAGQPLGPTTTTVGVPDTYTYEVADSAADLALDSAAHIGRSNGITRLADQEALLATVAAWRNESSGEPSWVSSDNHDFAVLLGHFFDCPVTPWADEGPTDEERAENERAERKVAQ